MSTTPNSRRNKGIVSHPSRACFLPPRCSSTRGCSLSSQPTSLVMTPNSSSPPSRHPHLKLIRATAAPAFSVVMSTTCVDRHLAALRSVAARCKELGAELVVAVPRGVTYDGLLDGKIRVLSVSDDVTPSDVRRLAMAEATGDIVLVLEWSALDADEWCDRIRRYDASSPMGSGSEKKRRQDAAIDWAAFLAVRGVIPVDSGSDLESYTPTFSHDTRRRARSMLAKWTEHLAAVEPVRPARQ